MEKFHEKIEIFWSDLYKIKETITYFTEILSLSNLSHDHLCNRIWVTWQNIVSDEQKLWHHNLFFNVQYFKETWSSQFDDINKGAIILIKTTLESSDFKRITKCVIECKRYFYSPIWHKLQIFRGKYWHQQDSRSELHEL